MNQEDEKSELLTLRGIYKCRNKDCLSKETIAYEENREQDDEPTTIIVTCTICYYVWKMN